MTQQAANIFGIVMPTADPRGGAETMLLRMLKANAVEPNIRYYVAFLEDGPMVATVRGFGYDVVVIMAGRLRQPHRLALAVGRLRQWIRKNRITLVLAWQEKAHLYSGWAAWLAGVKSAWYLHSIQYGTGLNAWVGRTPATAVICCGEYVRQVQTACYPKLPAYTVTIAVDLEQYDRRQLPSNAEARRQLGLPADGPVVGMVARLQRWKGVHVFVRAAASLAGRFPRATFVVVGGEWWNEPDYPAELADLVDRLGIGGRLRFAGQQSNVPVWMTAMDVVVHASDNEPTGTVIVEAMALGKAVVAADSPGPKEFAVPEVEALFAPFGNVNRLADQIGRLLEDENLARRLGEAAAVRALDYGSQRLAQRLADTLSRL